VASLINPKATNKMSEEKHVDYNSPEWRRRQEEFKQAYANESVMQELQFLRDQLAYADNTINKFSDRVVELEKHIQQIKSNDLAAERKRTEELRESLKELLEIAEYYHDRIVTYTQMPYSTWTSQINKAKNLLNEI
jgi:chromosome segregation ATPase